MKTFNIEGEKSFYVYVQIEAESQEDAEKEFLYTDLDDMDEFEEGNSTIRYIEMVEDSEDEE